MIILDGYYFDPVKSIRRGWCIGFILCLGNLGSKIVKKCKNIKTRRKYVAMFLKSIYP
jgi:hypothetical protein